MPTAQLLTDDIHAKTKMGLSPFKRAADPIFCIFQKGAHFHFCHFCGVRGSSADDYVIVAMMERYKPHYYEGGEGQLPDRPNLAEGYQKWHKTEEQTKLENSPEGRKAISRVKDVLATIDTNVLFGIFREYYGASGNNPHSLSITQANDIDVIYDPNVQSAGVYFPKRKPLINAAQTQNCTDDLIISVAIHELLHEATTTLPRMVFRSSQEGERLFSVWEKRTGLKIINSAVYSESINEGITQLLTDDIHAKYNKRIGQGNETTERQNRTATGFSPYFYLLEQYNARIYIALVAACTDVPEDVVKDAVTKAYFRNGAIVPENFMAFMADEYDLTLPNNLMVNKLENETFPSFVYKLAALLPKEKGKQLQHRIDELFGQLHAAQQSEE